MGKKQQILFLYVLNHSSIKLIKNLLKIFLKYIGYTMAYITLKRTY